MIRNIPVNLGSRPVSMQPQLSLRRSLQNVMGKKRMGGVLIYTTVALFMAVFCSFLFNSLEHDTEFAIAIMGSLIGGFLGALLAAALIVDIYLPKKHRDLDFDDN